MTDANLNDFCPDLQILYKEWLRQCTAAGLNTHAIVTWRDPADQDAAKAEGLSNAAAGQSPHNCCDATGNPASKAFDFGIFKADGSYVTNGTDAHYIQAGEIAEGIGLVWGGRWIHPDYDHIEMADWKTA